MLVGTQLLIALQHAKVIRMMDRNVNLDAFEQQLYLQVSAVRHVGSP